MWHDFIADTRFFEKLLEQDERNARLVRARGCGHCRGVLHRADYPRKPRGATVAAAGEAIDRRISLCCARDGCRRRATPPSLVFVGRRVYLAVAVLVESVRAVAGHAARAAPPGRTLRRWISWFQRDLVATRFFAAVRGRLWPPVIATAMPLCFVERFRTGATSAVEITFRALAFLAPVGASPCVQQALISRER